MNCIHTPYVSGGDHGNSSTEHLNTFQDQGFCIEPLEEQPVLQVVLKGDKADELESADYQDNETIFDATDQIAKVCKNVPIHVIYGEINDCMCVYLRLRSLSY
jgi:hypothetical protein